MGAQHPADRGAAHFHHVPHHGRTPRGCVTVRSFLLGCDEVSLNWRGIGGFTSPLGEADDLCPLRRQARLFKAVVTGDVVSRITQFSSAWQPSGDTIEERLVRLGDALLRWTLDNERMALMRLAVAEAQRFPDLASDVSRTARQLSTEVAARFLGEMAQSGELAKLPGLAPERLATTARFFLDLVVVPMLLRGLFEDKVETLDAEIGPHVKRTVPFFLAACRNGG